VGGAIVGAVSERIMHSDDDATRSWDTDRSNYRQYFDSTYSGSGRSWTDSEPHYRYGWETHRQPAYQGRAWSDVEPDVRKDWESRFPGQSWDQNRDYVRGSWDEPGTTTGHTHSYVGDTCDCGAKRPY
jgi:hypothetical protein